MKLKNNNLTERLYIQRIQIKYRWVKAINLTIQISMKAVLKIAVQ